MISGAEIQTTVGKLTLVDYCPFEPSAYCWDPGWWAVDAQDVQFYVSDEGIVYSNSTEYPDRYDVPIGKVVA